MKCFQITNKRAKKWHYTEENAISGVFGNSLKDMVCVIHISILGASVLCDLRRTWCTRIDGLFIRRVTRWIWVCYECKNWKSAYFNIPRIEWGGSEELQTFTWLHWQLTSRASQMEYHEMNWLCEPLHMTSPEEVIMPLIKAFEWTTWHKLVAILRMCGTWMELEPWGESGWFSYNSSNHVWYW